MTIIYCDICGSKTKKPVEIKSIYSTEGVTEVCDKCIASVNDLFDKITAEHHQIRTEKIKQWIRDNKKTA